ncbi:MAG: hypothetical protein ACLFTK_10475 [Anaerolineales bacterium]
MRTPDGRQCEYYYEDFHRGRDVQECRIGKTERSAAWQPRDCAKCPVPDILRANACPHLQMKIHIQKPILGIGHKVKVSAHCDKIDDQVENPYVGCPRCNEDRPGLDLFAQALENMDD